MKHLRFGGKMVHYFAYGSNLDLEQMKERIGKIPKIVGIGILHDYELKFNKWPGGYANVAEQKGKKVFGLVYELIEEDIGKLDRHEWVPNYYKHLNVRVEVDGQFFDCLTYKAAKTMEGINPPREYVQKIIKAMKKLEFPAEYIREIEKCM